MFNQQNATNPVAHITKRKNRLKVYSGNKIYLNEGSSFEIELFNPKQVTVLCKVKLNGNYISSSGVVLRPGERIHLERYLDSNNKFLFSVYEIGDSESARNAIQNNGLVEVEFYEETIPVPSYTSQITWNYPTKWDRFEYTYQPTTFNTNNVSNTVVTDTLNFVDTLSLNNTLSRKSKSIETGRVEKGERSNQKFTTVNMDFNNFTSHIVTYQILPDTQKPIQGHRIRKYCTNCGTKLKKKYRYCPNCGEES